MEDNFNKEECTSCPSSSNCSSGCGSNEYEDELVYLTFDGEEDIEVPCEVLQIFDFNEGEYIALGTRVDLMDEAVAADREDEVYFFRYKEDEDGEPMLEEIDSDEEWEAVSDEFSKQFFEPEE